MKFVEGSYATSQEAFAVVERLQSEGYKKDAIRLVSNATTKNNFMDQPDINVTTEDSYTQTTDHRTNDNRSMWEKIKDAFSAEDYDGNDSVRSEDDVLYNYQDDIAKGNSVVVVEGDPNAKSMTADKDTNTLNTSN
ncbi:MAG: general stress protein, partial [Carnobacterium sp.]